MNLKDMKEFIRLFDKSNLTELEIEEGDSRLYVSKLSKEYAQPVPYTAPVNYTSVPVVNTASADKKDKTGITIKSPIIGTYYSAPTPGAAPFVKAGDTVEKGQIMCIIEAMKIMNTIEADYRCVILKVLTENGNPVEYDQDIFVVEPL